MVSKFKKNQIDNAFCPYCKTKMKRTIKKQTWFEKIILGFPEIDRYDCENCGAGPF